MATTKQALGAYGEALAARHLIQGGMVLLDHNWRCPAGELDLVLRHGEVLVFCEVKTRRGLGQGTPLEAVGAQKLARLRRLAAQWIAAHGVHAPQVRIDLVGVFAPRGAAATIEHVAGVG